MNRSPLWMVTQEPSVTQLITYLQGEARELMQAPADRHVLRFTRTDLEQVREAFGRTIRRGESKLHHLGGLLSQTFFGASYELSSVVIGQVEGTPERFTLVQTLSPEELYALTDLDLGTRQLERLRFKSGESWSRAHLVANFVEYQPEELSGFGTHKIITRIKAEEEIWNKVVDEIFGLDELVQRDKQLRHLSRFVKDVFGLKVIVGDSDGVRNLHQHLSSHEWGEVELKQLGIPAEAGTHKLDFLEVKDYLTSRDPKKSGWKAMKSVVRWWDDTFEIQVQPLRNYLRERERLSSESHAGFKARRDELRNQVASAVPLFGFYRDLLRWLFRNSEGARPSFSGVSIEVT